MDSQEGDSISDTTKATKITMELIGKIGRGEIPSFFVNCHEVIKGMSCDGFSKKARGEVLKMVKGDDIFAKNKKAAKQVKADTISVGGCRGLRIIGEVPTPDNEGWVTNVNAFSDGKTLYLFTLRNKKNHYDQNIEVFEKVISTVKFTSMN